MTKAISVRDLLEEMAKEEMAKMCLGEPEASEQWVPLQSNNSHANTIQKYVSSKNDGAERHFRREYMDCTMIFRYVRGYAIIYKNPASIVHLYDKHWIKCREHGYTVAAAVQGRRVAESRNESVQLKDNDFCKFSIIPSV